MAREIQINAKQLLAAAFGNGIVQAYVLDAQELEAASSNITVLENDSYEAGDENGEGTGLLGLPIFQRIYFDDAGDVIELSDALVDVSLPRNIVKTQVNGLNGTVKEFVSNGDYEITIRGFLIGSNPYKAPEKEIRKFRKYFTDKTKALSVTGKIFDLLGIDKIVVENWTLPQLPTYINIRPFELKCVSDIGDEKYIELNTEE